MTDVACVLLPSIFFICSMVGLVLKREAFCVIGTGFSGPDALPQQSQIEANHRISFTALCPLVPC